jgi:hypothetical protein
MILLVLLGVFWSVSKIISGGPLTLRDQSGFEQIPQNQLPLLVSRHSQATPWIAVNNHKQLMLGYRPGTSAGAGCLLAMQKSFQVKDRSQHHLRFFISTLAPTQGDFETLVAWNPGDFEYMICINGAVIDSGDLDRFKDNRYYSFASSGVLEFARQMNLQLVIRNKQPIERVAENRCPVIALELIDLQ